MNTDIEKAILKILVEGVDVIPNSEEVIIGFDNGNPFTLLKQFGVYAEVQLSWLSISSIETIRKVAIYVINNNEWEVIENQRIPVVYVRLIRGDNNFTFHTFLYTEDLGSCISILNNGMIVPSGNGRTGEHKLKIQEWI